LYQVYELEHVLLLFFGTIFLLFRRFNLYSLIYLFVNKIASLSNLISIKYTNYDNKIN